jgi:hypothetical protein
VQLQIVALIPPGNIGRELALYRRALFHRLGEASALAFPEFVPLAAAPRPARAMPRREAQAALAGCWKGADGSFSSAGPLLSGGLLYLEMLGPLAALVAASPRSLAAASEEGAASGSFACPLEPGIGVFLCKPSDPEIALGVALELGPPKLEFRDCALALLSFRLGADPFAAMAWRQLARARRLAGAPA